MRFIESARRIDSAGRRRTRDPGRTGPRLAPTAVSHPPSWLERPAVVRSGARRRLSPGPRSMGPAPVDAGFLSSRTRRLVGSRSTVLEPPSRRVRRARQAVVALESSRRPDRCVDPYPPSVAGRRPRERGSSRSLHSPTASPTSRSIRRLDRDPASSTLRPIDRDGRLLPVEWGPKRVQGDSTAMPRAGARTSVVAPSPLDQHAAGPGVDSSVRVTVSTRWRTRSLLPASRPAHELFGRSAADSVRRRDRRVRRGSRVRYGLYTAY